MASGRVLKIFLVFSALLLWFCLQLVQSCGVLTEKGTTYFPGNFTFGVATAAYQIEGGWNDDGKGPSNWDTFTHDYPQKIDDHSNGDVSADSYHRFEQDLAALIELKVDFYRFSVAWSRVLPSGDISSFNQAGIDYYNRIIDKLIKNGIEPMVTMFHYDLPDELQKIGGFTNPLFTKYFEQYANILYKHFGDRVKTWITFNEPFDYCIPGYGNANYPPQINAPGIADYLCMDHTLKAHAVAYRLYRKNYYQQFGGKIGITLSSRFFFSHKSDMDIIDRAMSYGLGWLVHPIFSKSGGYPEIMISDIASNSLREGRAWSRLPELDENWKNIIHGAGDFLGINYYTTRYIDDANPPQGANPSWDRDARLNYTIDSSWTRGKSSWLYCVPKGLEELLKYIRDEYDNVEVIITENGWSDNGELEDNGRVNYLKAHLQAVLNAVNDGCNVSAYTVWSLLDNFEWQRGYTEKFGLYNVDFQSDDKKRTAKKSAHFYKEVLENRTIPKHY